MIATNVKDYDRLARLLEYPKPGYLDDLSACHQLCGSQTTEAGTLLQEFTQALGHLPLGDIEELYSRTFDINPVSCLNVGWHLFGENYARGTFLVRMRQLLRQNGIEESTELPDHLPHLLRLLSRLDAEEAGALTRESVLPALRKMIEGFEEQTNPYQLALRAVELILTRGLDPRNGGHHG